MMRKIESRHMGAGDHGWLKSKFHFSFAEYFNPNNMHFGVLRVVNDDLVQSGTGFDLHPHRDMEIISYVVNGKLTHGDSMGNQGTITRGHVQYMSAGTGVFHSERNGGQETLRFLQIWILPDRKGYEPTYGDYRFEWKDRHNQWLHMVSGPEGNAPIQIHQDCNLYAVDLEAGLTIDFLVSEGRQAYLVQIEGASTISGLALADRDAMEIEEEQVVIHADQTSHILVIEMKNQI